MRRNTHGFRRDHLIGERILQDSILMNPGLVREGIRAHHGLVWRHGDAGNFREQPAGAIQLVQPQPRAGLIAVGAHGQSHRDFFHGRVSGAFANSVNGALHLARARFHRRQRIGHGQP